MGDLRNKFQEGTVRATPACPMCGRFIANPHDPNLGFQPEQHGPGLIGECPGCGETLYLRPVKAEGWAVFRGYREDDR